MKRLPSPLIKSNFFIILDNSNVNSLGTKNDYFSGASGISSNNLNNNYYSNINSGVSKQRGFSNPPRSTGLKQEHSQSFKQKGSNMKI